MFRILDLQIYFIYCNPVICHFKETKASFASKTCDLIEWLPKHKSSSLNESVSIRSSDLKLVWHGFSWYLSWFSLFRSGLVVLDQLYKLNTTWVAREDQQTTLNWFQQGYGSCNVNSMGRMYLHIKDPCTWPAFRSVTPGTVWQITVLEVYCIRLWRAHLHVS